VLYIRYRKEAIGIKPKPMHVLFPHFLEVIPSYPYSSSRLC
jgi:hypothetical protein